MLLLVVLTIAAALLLCRIFLVLHTIGTPLPSGRQSCKTLIVLGSGGHTAEMLDVVAMLDKSKYSPRCYVAGATDNMSLPRAQHAEENSFLSSRPEGVEFWQVFRSREVGQSYLTSFLTTLMATIHSLWIVFRVQPDLILCNGPGTCLPICVVGFVLHVIGVKRVIVVYVESIARVKRLSLTGLILYKLGVMDQFFVQWPFLKQQFPNANYVGRLM